MATQPTSKANQTFQKYIDGQRKLIQTLLDGLAPDVPQEQRDVLRQTFQPLGTGPAETPSGEKPGVPDRAAPLE